MKPGYYLLCFDSIAADTQLIITAVHMGILNATEIKYVPNVTYCFYERTLASISPIQFKSINYPQQRYSTTTLSIAIEKCNSAHSDWLMSPVGIMLLPNDCIKLQSLLLQCSECMTGQGLCNSYVSAKVKPPVCTRPLISVIYLM